MEFTSYYYVSCADHNQQSFNWKVIEYRPKALVIWLQQEGGAFD